MFPTRRPFPNNLEAARYGGSDALLRLTNADEMEIFLDRRVEQLESLAISIAHERAEWNGLIPPPILPAPRIFDAPIRAYLIREFDVGGPPWTPQFILGFPILGAIGMSETFGIRTRKRKDSDSSGDPSQICPGSPDRFTRRPLSPKPQKSKELRCDATDR